MRTNTRRKNENRKLIPIYVIQGIVCSGIAYYMQSVVNKARGPVFVTAFSPLSMIITAVLGAIVLAEQVHLGRYSFIHSIKIRL